MNAYAILGLASLVTMVVTGFAMFLVRQSARDAGAAEVEAKLAKAEVQAEGAVIAVANQGESDEETVDSLNSGKF